MTATDFGRNRLGSGGETTDYSAGDPPEMVADLIAAAIEGGDAQYFVNDFLRKLAGA
jgi:hypothetical protein